jgi:hypothetical protein
LSECGAAGGRAVGRRKTVYTSTLRPSEANRKVALCNNYYLFSFLMKFLFASTCSIDKIKELEKYAFNIRKKR